MLRNNKIYWKNNTNYCYFQKKKLEAIFDNGPNISVKIQDQLKMAKFLYLLVFI